MLRKMLLLLVVVACVVCYSGCKKDSDVEVKSAAEYKEEADKAIGSSNMESELDKIEEEVDAPEE